MKKRQAVLFVLAAAAFLALSGCDAILEVFYPEFAYSRGSENVISIWAQFDMYPSQISGANQYIGGRVTDTKSGEVVREVGAEPFWHWIEEKNLIYWHLEGNLDIFDIPDGEYEVEVWLEQSGDGKPYGADEPTVFATRVTDGAATFTFPSDKSSDGWVYGEASVALR